MSDHSIEVLELDNMETHPNADRLAITRIHGFTCCIQKDDYKLGDLIAYIPPDSLVKLDRPEFAFLKKPESDKTQHRVKVVKLRGVVSQGLVLKAPEGSKVGDDVAELLEIEHYEPVISLRGGELASPPSIYVPVYDVENLRRIPIITEGEEIVALEKLDGCFRSNTNITMADFTVKRITNITKGDLVLGVDNDGLLTETKVTKVFKHVQTKDWLKIGGTRYLAGPGCNKFSITCTPEHRIFNVDRSDFVEAQYLNIGDTLLSARMDMQLTPIQEQILLGKLIGDGCLKQEKYTAAVEWSHKIEHEDYVLWTAKGLGDLVAAKPYFAKAGGYSGDTQICYMRTIYNRFIKDKYTSLYDANNCRVIPSWVIKELAPISLAFLYMDDGNLSSQTGKTEAASIGTCSYSKESCEILVAAFDKFNIKVLISESRGYNSLKLNAVEAEKLFLLITPYVPKCMQYKLPERYRGYNAWLPENGDKTFRKALIPQKIEFINRIDGNYFKHDLETETHNYFAGGILVHNSNYRITFVDNQLHVGSRTTWKKESDDSQWWQFVMCNPWIREFCEAHPGLVVFGEAFGNVGRIKYCGGKRLLLRVFDILDGNRWLEYDEILEIGKDVLQFAPEIYRGPYSAEKLVSLAEGVSMIDPSVIREGIVISPIISRTDPKIGRVKLKLVSNEYLMKY